jgi:hypothetical protein
MPDEWRPFLPAVKVLALALVVVIGAAVLLWLGGATQQVANEGRAKIPGTVAFDADVRRYEILISPRIGGGRPTAEDLAGRVDCTVTQPGGETVAIDGARVTSRTTTDFGTTIGRFDGKGGPTSVACEWRTTAAGLGASNRFIVAKERTLVRNIAFGGFALAGILVVAGLLMIRRAHRRRVAP